MKGTKRLILLVLVGLIVSMNTKAQKARYQGEIIYRLSKYISWPKNNKDYKFVIGVIGNREDFTSFQQLALEKGGFQDVPVEVRYFECTDTIDECQLIYVSEQCDISIERIIKKTKHDPILIVSGKKGYGQEGAVINFVDVNGKLNLEYNEQEATKRGLLVSEKIKSIVKVI